MRFSRHSQCEESHVTWQIEDGSTQERSCVSCLLHHLFDRVLHMPTSADFDAAIAAVSTAIDAGFADLSQTVTDETALIVTALQGAGVPQASIDAVTGLGAKLTAGFAALKTAVQSELPAPSAG